MARGPHPSGEPTMRDVAAEAAVSKALVSIVFRGVPGASAETRTKVLVAAEKLGYRRHRTASLLASRRTRQIGVVHDLQNGFHSEIVASIIRSADAADYQAVVSPRTARHGDTAAIASALDFRCEALILLGPVLSDDDLFQVVSSIPTVVIGREFEAAGIDVAEGDDAAGMRAVVDHLVSLGHSDLVHVDGGTGRIAARRREGFTAAAKAAGADARVVEGGATEEAGFAATRKVLELTPLPTAVVGFNDLCALGLLGAMTDAGLDLPSQMSITGYDDSPLARTRTISLTSVAQDAEELGEWAVQAVLQRLDGGRTEPTSLVVEPRLHIRGTTVPPND